MNQSSVTHITFLSQTQKTPLARQTMALQPNNRREPIADGRGVRNLVSRVVVSVNLISPVDVSIVDLSAICLHIVDKYF